MPGGVVGLRLEIGSVVVDPRDRGPERRVGRVVAIRTNPACLMRVLAIEWADCDGGAAEEELEEIEFGPLEDGARGVTERKGLRERGGPTVMDIRMGRIYHETPAGVERILVDRLWPRGVRKDHTLWDVWLKGIAPSARLRSWYHAHPDARGEFTEGYREELRHLGDSPDWEALVALARRGPIVLLTATQDVSASQVPALRDALIEHLTIG